MHRRLILPFFCLIIMTSCISVSKKSDPFGAPNSVVIEFQQLLAQQGLYSGEVDGTLNKSTSEAVKVFQKLHGMPPNGKITRELQLRLLKASAVSAQKDPSTLLKAASKGDTASVERLMLSGYAVNTKHHNGWTPLMFACAGGHVETAKLLLNSGADVNTIDDNGYTPLMAAALTGDQDLVEQFLLHGVITQHKKKPLLEFYKQDVTALIIAWQKGYHAIEKLLELGLSFVYIPPGSFTMGSPSGEPGRSKDEKQHRVTITQGFYMQTTEVTQRQWKVLMGNNPSDIFHKGDIGPVERVSWDDAQEFIKRLNQRVGSVKYRLPTEAEWEYACRAGSTTTIYTGDIKIIGQRNAPALDGIAWYGGNSCHDPSYLMTVHNCSKWKEKQYSCESCCTHPVAQKEPNAYGLYDMLGNVYEWCMDKGDWKKKVITDTYKDEIIDPLSKKGPFRIIRGGSWSSQAQFCRSAQRNVKRADRKKNYIGFRLVMNP